MLVGAGKTSGLVALIKPYLYHICKEGILEAQAKVNTKIKHSPYLRIVSEPLQLRSKKISAKKFEISFSSHTSNKKATKCTYVT